MGGLGQSQPSLMGDANSPVSPRPRGGANPALLMHIKTKLASKLQIKAGSASVTPSTAIPVVKDVELPTNWIKSAVS